jgi:hypothetical protein
MSSGLLVSAKMLHPAELFQGAQQSRLVCPTRCRGPSQHSTSLLLRPAALALEAFSPALSSPPRRGSASASATVSFENIRVWAV